MYVRVLHHIKFHCILTRVHNLRHMLSTCYYVKTFINLMYVLIENELRDIKFYIFNAHAKHI